MKAVDIVPLRGGLGNQLFCWAYGLQLAARNRTVLYDRGTSLGRGYALDSLVASGRLIKLPSALWRRVGRLTDNGFMRRIGLRVNVEADDGGMSSRQLGGGINLHFGYWQSQDYFQEVEGEVIDRLSEWLSLPEQPPADYCAVHVRRGDYITDPGAAAALGALDLSYYKEAIDRMREKGHRKFVVFSDDRAWVRQNLVMSDVELAARGDSMADFRGLSLGRGVVMSNSTFSWWSGFLADSRGADIIAPVRWFNDGRSYGDRITLERWTRI